MKKRLLSVLLVISLLIGLLPAMAFAGTESGVETYHWAVVEGEGAAYPKLVISYDEYTPAAGETVAESKSGTFMQDVVFANEGEPWRDDLPEVLSVEILAGAGGEKVAPYSAASWFDMGDTTSSYDIQFDWSGLDTSSVTSMARMFYACWNVTNLDLSSFDTSNVKSLACMFYDCQSLKTLDVSTWNTSNVTNMNYVFQSCNFETIDVSSWDTSNVTSMSGIFCDCCGLKAIDLSSFNTSKVTDMGDMFCGDAIETFVADKWDVSRVYGLWGIFSVCNKLKTVDINELTVKENQCIYENCPVEEGYTFEMKTEKIVVLNGDWTIKATIQATDGKMKFDLYESDGLIVTNEDNLVVIAGQASEAKTITPVGNVQLKYNEEEGKIEVLLGNGSSYTGMDEVAYTLTGNPMIGAKGEVIGTVNAGAHTHTAAEAVEENPDTENGICDRVVYCEECGAQISRERANLLTGTASVSGTVKCGETLTASLTGSNNTGNLSYRWKRGGVDIANATSNTYTLTAEDIGSTISVVISSSKESGSVTSAATAAVAKANGPVAPNGLAGVKPTSFGGTDGKITGTTAEMEYSTSNSFTSSASCADTETTGLGEGTYYVRVKATASTEAGAYAVVSVPEGDKADFTGITAANHSGSYDGTQQGIAISGVPDGATVKYGTVSGTYDLDSLTFTNATDGEVTVYFKVSKIGYNDFTGSATVKILPRVTLQQGGFIKYTAETVSVSGGNVEFTFDESKIEDGVYNLVVEFGNKTVTSVKEYGSEAPQSNTVEVPEKQVQAIVKETDEKTPDVVADGLNEVAEDNAVSDKMVTIELAVEYEEESQVDATPLDAIETEDKTSGQSGTIEYFDIQITKTVDSTTTNITDTNGKLVSIVIPFNVSGRTGFKVIRYHGTAAETLTELNDTDSPVEGSFRIDKTAGAITIYAEKFSTYAICYSDVVESPNAHIISGTDTENGKVTVNKKYAVEGEQITITASPDEGYVLGVLTVKDGNGKEIALTVKEEGKVYSFKMPSSRITIEATFRKSISDDEWYTDVPESEWFYGPIYYCTVHKLFEGYEDYTFRPERTMTEAELATLLYRVANGAYTSNEEDWYVIPRDWALEKGVMSSFAADEPVTRAEFIEMFYNTIRLTGKYDSAVLSEDFEGLKKATDYEEVGRLSESTLNAIAWSVAHGLITGTAEDDDVTLTITPDTDIKRDEVATMLMRYYSGLK